MIKELNWVSVENELPEENEPVLVTNRHGEYVVARINKGLSLTERENLRIGELIRDYPLEIVGVTSLEDGNEVTTFVKKERWKVVFHCDERPINMIADGDYHFIDKKCSGTKNEVPYSWQVAPRIRTEPMKNIEIPGHRISHWARLTEAK